LWPVIDIGNHRPIEQVQWAVDTKGFALSILGDINAGEQIYNNYAPKGNEERE
jgi:hypothetical protein